MDLDSSLLILTAIWCGVALVAALRSRPFALEPCLVIGAIGVLTLSSWYAAPAYAARIGFVLALLFLLAPGYLARSSARAVLRQQFWLARVLLSIAQTLRPFARARSNDKILVALEFAQRGELERASERLRALARGGPLQASALATLARIEGNWEALVAFADHGARAPLAESAPELLPHVLRARGETADLAGMIRDFSAFVRARGPAAPGSNEARLFVHAFVGHVDAVTCLIEGPLGSLSAELRDFWTSTARLAAGERGMYGRLSALARRADPLNRLSFERRLAVQLGDPRALDAAARAFVEHDRRVVLQNTRYAYGQSRGAAWVTWSLVALNIAMFGLEVWSGGSDDRATLLRLGAVTKPLSGVSELWRALAATFLHFGGLHLGFNMFGLLVLGPPVERAYGWPRFALIYLLSGFASMLGAIAFSPQDSIVVGASGSIMALLGAQLAIALSARSRGVPLARRHLAALSAAVILQTVLDVLTPQISLSAHVAGLLSGFTLSCVLARGALAGERRKPSQPA